MAEPVGGVLLVVDEDGQRAQQVEDLFATDGITVLHAKTVGQAVDLLHALGTACCILISMTLPARGAWELLSRLRSERLPERACAAILYGPQTIIDSEPRIAPVIGMLPAPLDTAALCEIVREHCLPKPKSKADRRAAGSRT